MTAGGAAALFVRAFGRAPAVVASAPGRVNLIGEHTDYNGGEVLPIAIDRRTWVAMARSAGPRSRAVSMNVEGHGAFDAQEPRPAGAWWDYVHGALRELAAAGAIAGPVDVAVASEVPTGAGLSSSAALEVATVLAGSVIAGVAASDLRVPVATIAHRAETGFVGVSCGIMDQTASACAEAGHALRLWCDTGARELVPFDQRVLVIDTAAPRALRASAFNARQASCARAFRALHAAFPLVTALAHATPAQLDAVALAPEDRRRATHVVLESARVGALVAALQSGASLGALLAASHASLRHDYDCSSPELDWVVDVATRIVGVDGARMTGAGWGGCAIVVGTEEALETLASTVGPAFEGRWGRAPRAWLTSADAGGRIEA